MVANKIIKSLMKENGMSAVRMGDKIGVKGKTLSRRLENTNPTVESLLPVLEELGYELVIQKKRAGGKRASGQYVVTRVVEKES